MANSTPQQTALMANAGEALSLLERLERTATDYACENIEAKKALQRIAMLMDALEEPLRVIARIAAEELAA